jgi:hypothetical protein
MPQSEVVSPVYALTKEHNNIAFAIYTSAIVGLPSEILENSEELLVRS